MKSYYEQQTSNQSKLKITNMNIESHLKQAGYPDEYDVQKYSFEQRGTNDLEREKFYFNQPCLELKF